MHFPGSPGTYACRTKQPWYLIELKANIFFFFFFFFSFLNEMIEKENILMPCDLSLLVVYKSTTTD